VFAPLKSLVRQRLSRQLPLWLSRLPQVRQEWDDEGLTIEDKLEFNSKVGRRLLFTSDGQFLVSAQGHNVRLWDPATGALTGAIMPPEAQLFGVRLSQDASLVSYIYLPLDYLRAALGRVTLTVRFWDIKMLTMRTVLEFSMNVTDFVKGLCQEKFRLSPNGEFFTAGLATGVVLWDSRTSRLHMEIPCSNVWGRPEFSPDGRLLALKFYSGIKFWDVRLRKRVSVLKDKAEGKIGDIGSFSAAGNLFAFGSGEAVRRVARGGKC
jgi:WD40 repeat protein